MSNEQEKAVTTTVELEKSLVSAGFGSANSFELLVRQANMISSSSLVPEQFSIFDKKGNLKSPQDQKYALANATIAMEMAARIGASPLAVCQNLYIVQGRPSWSSQFVIAMVNACGRYSPLRFTLSEPEAEREVIYEFTEWENNKKVSKTVKEKIRNYTCYAWAIEKSTGERLEGPAVSLEMAVKEGWLSKPGSKWKTMEGLMMRYRAAAFFGRLYAPELMMGIQTDTEMEDVIDITPGSPTNGQTVKGKAKAASILSAFDDPAIPENEPPVGECEMESEALNPNPQTGEIPITAEEAAEVATPCPQCKQAGTHSDSCPLAEPPPETQDGLPFN